jgi:DNA-binding GntR family transcriptional regulator
MMDAMREAQAGAGATLIDRDAPQAVFRQIADIIRGRIGTGEYPANGGPIPSQAKLCGEFGVAPHTLRSALRLLSDEGVLLIIPNKGSYVVPPKD